MAKRRPRPQSLTRRWGWERVYLTGGGFILQVWFLYSRKGSLFTVTQLVNPEILRLLPYARRDAFAGVLRKMRLLRYKAVV